MKIREIQSGSKDRRTTIYECEDRGQTFYVGHSVVIQLEKSLNLANILGTDQTSTERAFTIIENVMTTTPEHVNKGIFDKVYSYSDSNAGELKIWAAPVTAQYGPNLRAGCPFIGDVQIIRAH